MADKIFLQVGSHRTASTHFQRTLLENKQALAAAGLRYVHLYLVPGYRDATKRLRRSAEAGGLDGEAAAQIAAVHARLAEEHRDAAGLLLSYEGQLGSMALDRAGGLYPAHEQLLAAISDMFPGRRLVVGFSIRSYDAFVESCYKLLVRVGYDKPFAEFVAGFDLQAMSWLPSVEALVKRLGPERTLIWSFEAYTADTPGFHKWLFGQLEAPEVGMAIRIPAEKVNASSSSLGLSLSLASNKILRETVTGKKERRRAMTTLNHAIQALTDDTGSKPELLDGASKQTLRDRYTADLERISALVPNTSYL